jgi:fucose permease
MAGGTFSLFMATIPAESAPAARVTTAMALIMGTGELFGGAAAPTVVGWLADQYGLTAPLVAEIVFAGAATLLSFSLVETAPLTQALLRRRPVL